MASEPTQTDIGRVMAIEPGLPKPTEVLFTVVDSHVGYVEPVRFHAGDAGYDLASVRSVVVQPQTFAMITTNVKVALPPGTWGMIVGRSSTFYKKNLLVNIGIIDNGWRGELIIVIFNPTRRKIMVKPGERLAQLIIYNLVTPTFRYVRELPPGDRGEEGFGSTDKVKT